MKKIGRRFGALALAFVLAAGAGQTAFASLALGSELSGQSITLAEGTTLTSQSLWSASKSDLRTEHYVTYTPGGAVKPVVFSGTYVASTNTVAAAAAQMEGQGYRVAAAMNGGFFNTDGTIVGLLVTDGVVRSIDVDNYTLLGFTNDGRVFIDESRPQVTAAWTAVMEVQPDPGVGPDGEPVPATESVEYQNVARSFPVAGFNAYRNKNFLGGLYLYNQDFSSRVNSGGTCVSAILRPLEEGGMKMDGVMTFEVVSVTDTAREGVSFNGVIPEGCYMLYGEDHDNAELLDSLRGMVVGSQVTITTGGVSGQWADAAYGISGLYTLLRGGEVVSGLPTAANPYTAVGLKPDGTAVFYTIDGRQSGYSVGATYSQVAERLQELGCTTAVALDGGGSTTLGATMPGSTGFSIVNSPSENGRRINNTILLVGPETGPSGEPAGAYVTADRQVVFTGSELTVSATPYDTAGYPMSNRVPVWTTTGGIVLANEDPMTATYSCIVPGSFSISGDPSGEGAMAVEVVDGLSTLTVRREDGAALTGELQLSPGDEVELAASGSWWGLPVAIDDKDVKWTVDSAVGKIDGTGHFTAGQDIARGTITASAGGRTATIQVSVVRDDPFTDMEGHWAASYVTRLYQLGLTSGYELEDGSFVFRPNGQLTRGELLTFITRLLGVDTDKYEDVELPFADAGSIPGWLQPSVKAMYALQVFEGTEMGGKLYADVGSNVTREAAITMLGRVLEDSRSADLSGFADANDVSAWARPYVETLVSLGVVEGSDGLLTPKADITRGAAAKLLVEVYGLEKAELTLRPGLAGEEEPVPVEPSGPVEPAQPSWPGDAPTFVNPVDSVDLPVRDKPADNPAISDPWNWTLPMN